MTDRRTAAPEALADPLSRRLMSGSTWMVGMRFAVRGIGLLSTVVLARVLTPADFGVMAMAMLLIGFIEVFSDIECQYALIRHPDPDRSHYDSAWTMGLGLNTAASILIVAIAPLAPLYFGDARIVPVIQLLSLRLFLSGLVNIGTVEFRRSLNFAKEFQFGVTRKLLTFGVTLTLAFLWKSYWALAVGVVVGHALEVVLSYIMHPFRPRLDLSRFKELWGYSVWLLFAALGRYLEGRIDEVVVAGVAPPSDLGTYAVGTEVGQLPVTEVLDPVARALFPNYARLAANLNDLARAYLQVLSGITTIAVATSVGIALVAPDLVVVMLGPKWADVAPLVVWFALAAGINGICNTVFPVLNAAGETRLSAIQTWMRVALYVPCMLWAATAGSLVYFAMAKLAVAVVLIPTFFVRLRQIVPVTWSELGHSVWRPPLAAAVMAVAVKALDQSVLTTDVAFLRLGACAMVGAAVFIATQLSLWAVAGAPAGFERILLRTARGALRV